MNLVNRTENLTPPQQKLDRTNAKIIASFTCSISVDIFMLKFAYSLPRKYHLNQIQYILTLSDPSVLRGYGRVDNGRSAEKWNKRHN